MPEVIDLLSSPEAAPAPKPRPKSDAAIAVQQAWVWPESRPKPKPTPQPDDDVVNLTDPTVITSFLQSPLPQLTSRGSAPASKPKSPKPSHAADFLIFSDDVDTTVDLSEAPSDPRPSKKPRVECNTHYGTRNMNGGLSEKTNQKSTLKSVAGPPLLRKPIESRKGIPTLDPIQTSSDPFASSPHAAPKAKAGPAIIDLGKDDDDDDPFASSPHPDEGNNTQENSTKAGTRLPLSSPLFASSPPSRLGGLPLQNTKFQTKTKGSLAWDHISSSAPEADIQDDWLFDDATKSGRNGLKRSRSDSNDFDLGDLARVSWSSEDESLPDTNALRPLKNVPNGTKSTAAAKRATKSKKSEADKDLEKSARAAAREAEKQRKRREKEDIKEEKKREKERAAALAEVNKVRTDKKFSTPEMIVDLPVSLNPSVKLQIETLLEDLSVKCHSYSSPVKNVIKWRRKVKARFNDDEGLWEPIRERIEEENHAMVILHAAELVELVLGSKGSDLEAHTMKLQRNYENRTLIYLVEGLVPWMRKNRMVRNRQFVSAVRSIGAQTEPIAVDNAAPPPSTQRSRKKDLKPPSVYIDEDSVEDALLQLQLLHGALVHHTASPVETAQWVTIFTQHISTIPYRKQKDAANASAAFCMDSGQVRTGDGAQDTYVRLLQEIVRVTPPIAYGINAKFPTVTKLVKGFQHQGPLALESIKKSANKDGAFTDRTVGQAISRRVHKVFTGRDEGSTDI